MIHESRSSSTTSIVPTGGVAVPKASPATTKTAYVTTTLDHTPLRETDREAIRSFFGIAINMLMRFALVHDNLALPRPLANQFALWTLHSVWT